MLGWARARDRRISLRTMTGSVVALATVAAVLLFPNGARAEEVLDQQNVADGSGGDGSSIPRAQTFTAGISGPLSRVDLALFRNANVSDCEFQVEIWDTTAGAPGRALTGETLRSSDVTSVPAAEIFLPVIFASPADVTAGTQYAIVLHSSCTGGSVFWQFVANTYAAGQSHTLAPGGWEADPTQDYLFKTFVRLPSPVLASPAHGSTTDDSTPLFSGTADTSAGSDLTAVTIQVFQGTSTAGAPFLTLSADPDDSSGAFAATSSSPLPAGTYTARARQNNTGGATGTGNTNVFAIDAAAPPATGTGTGTGTGTRTGTGTGTGTGTVPAPPETTITSPLFEKTRDRTPTFTFVSSETGSRFECSVDGAAFAACTSPFTLPELGRGDHSFLVRAIDADGDIDPTPARADFKVKKRQKKKR